MPLQCILTWRHFCCKIIPGVWTIHFNQSDNFIIASVRVFAHEKEVAIALDNSQQPTRGAPRQFAQGASLILVPM